jgi:DNA-binding CsgD family transcriptional regulator
VARIDGGRFRRSGQTYGYLVFGSEEASLAELSLAELTPSERDVVGLLAGGCSNREIARRRCASVHTVGNQLAAIYEKLGVSSRHELVARLALGPRSA